ncbi:DDE_3 domain-containing protein [Trichonephila clavipes]|nr:DDE_3 domain-containing protein [Trichonephila clavipes]
MIFYVVELWDDWNKDVPSWKDPRNFESPRVSPPGFGNDSKMIVMFSLRSDSRRTLIWRAPGTRYHQEGITERQRYGGAGWLVWEGNILGSRADLHVQSVTMAGHIYRDIILEQYVRLFRGAMGAEFLLMDDNTRPHRANSGFESNRACCPSGRGALNSRRAVSPLVRLVTGDERWKTPDPLPGCSSSKLRWDRVKSYCHLMVSKAETSSRHTLAMVNFVGLDQTISDRALITNFFIPELNNHDVQELWFQQDGATCHTARATIDLLKDTFDDRLISRFGPVNWPPRSCDLTPLDYFLRGCVKSLVYAETHCKTDLAAIRYTTHYNIFRHTAANRLVFVTCNERLHPLSIAWSHLRHPSGNFCTTRNPYYTQGSDVTRG